MPEMPLAATVSKKIPSFALITVAFEVEVEFNSRKYVEAIAILAGVVGKTESFRIIFLC